MVNQPGPLLHEAAPVSARIAPLSPTRRAMKGRMGDVMTMGMFN